jgi:large subunit ribosomal protein L9
MKVILTKKCQLGLPGKIVEVKPGYATNFLFPGQLAVVADKKNILSWEEKLKLEQTEKKNQTDKNDQLLGKLRGQKIVLNLKANEQGHLYAAVNKNDLIGAIKEQLKIDLVGEVVEFKEIVKLVGSSKINLQVNGQDLTMKLEVLAEK